MLDGQNKNGETNTKLSIINLGGNFGLKYSNLFAGLPLDVEGGSFSPRLFTAIIGSVLQMQC